MFRIKICGVTTPDDARHIVEAGADAVGLNFYPHSKRFVDVDAALEIRRAIGGRAAVVGLFVNAPASHIRSLAERIQLDMIQLHGDEPPELVADLHPLPVLRAFRVSMDTAPHIVAHIEQSYRLGSPPDALLVDAYREGEYGGTGAVANWSLVEQIQISWKGRIVLAGGLCAENVAAAIASTRVWGVDVASGVESSPGVKDCLKVQGFVDEARKGFSGAPRL